MREFGKRKRGRVGGREEGGRERGRDRKQTDREKTDKRHRERARQIVRDICRLLGEQNQKERERVLDACRKKDAQMSFVFCIHVCLI